MSDDIELPDGPLTFVNIEQLDALRKALEEIADRDWVENALDPQWAAERARKALEP